MEQANTPFHRVCVMNEAFGNPSGINGIDWARVAKQASNLHSELKELRAAIRNHDIDSPDGVRDACCDIKVFLYGVLHFIGRDFGENPKVFVDSAPADFNRDDLFVWLISHFDQMDDLIARVESAIGNQDVTGVHQAARALALPIFEAYRVLGLDIDADMHNVIDGVFTRLCSSQEELDDTVKKYEAEGIEVYTGGVFPHAYVKSARDQGTEHAKGKFEFPKGKFLKNVNFKQAIFSPSGW